MSPSYMPYYFEVNGKLAFLSPFHSGAGTNWSPLTDAPLLRLDGSAQDRLAIPGASIRGALRSLLLREAPLAGCGEQIWNNLFGVQEYAGRVTVFDAIQTGALDKSSQVRDHVSIDIQTGAAAGGAKFDEEVQGFRDLSFTFRLIYRGENEGDDELRLLKEGLRRLQQGEVRLGGKAGRGYGRAELQEAKFFAFDRKTAEGLTAFAQFRHDGAAVQEHDLGFDPANREPLPAAAGPRPFAYYDFEILLRFEGPVLVKTQPPAAPPPEQLLEEISGADETARLSALAADSRLKPGAADFVFFESAPGVPCLPGSSLRGVLRSQASRICDCVQIGPTLAATLFGSPRGRKGEKTGSRGLLEIGDAELVGQPRLLFLDHVAIDRITGFAAAQMKFAQCALDSPAFRLRARLSVTRDHRAAAALWWQLLRDLQEGRLRFGSGSARGYGKLKSAAIVTCAADVPANQSMPAPPAAAPRGAGRTFAAVAGENMDWYWKSLEEAWKTAQNSSLYA